MLKYIIILALIIWFVCYKDSIKFDVYTKSIDKRKENTTNQCHKHRRWD